MSDEVERIAGMEDPFQLLRLATERLADAQRDVTELSRLRKRVIQDLHSQGMSYAQIAEAAGLSRGRIHQIRHQGPAPEGAFLGTGLVRIVTPLKRDVIKGRPVVAMEDVAASKRLEDLARSYGLDVEQEHVSLTGEIDLNRPGLIVICGPRLSQTMRQLYERDPVLTWEQTSAGAWALRDYGYGKTVCLWQRSPTTRILRCSVSRQIASSGRQRLGHCLHRYSSTGNSGCRPSTYQRTCHSVGAAERQQLLSRRGSQV